ncbi:MAG: BrnA antitoxin family protein [Gammaproteobacteria bacterium]|nr:BrnA antitoxin family protein [Gammaproteobacteria bacterium]
MKKHSKFSRTDWARIKKIKDDEIDYSDNPELDEAFLKEAVLWHGTKKQITLRIDPDVLDFFRHTGRGYQTVINLVLRKYMEISQHHKPAHSVER